MTAVEEDFSQGVMLDEQVTKLQVECNKVRSTPYLELHLLTDYTAKRRFKPVLHQNRPTLRKES
jgi:hypothetical protein